MNENILILGAGESGVGAAKLALSMLQYGFARRQAAFRRYENLRVSGP